MNSARPVVSVLVLAYNHGSYIREALEGIVQQAFDGPFEVIVGDDASSDDTGAIAIEFANRYPGFVKVVQRPVNVGMHANHAGLVALAQGEFIAYCEGDDYWHARDKLQRQVAFLRTHPEVGAVHADFDRIVSVRGGWKALRRSNHAFGREIPVGHVFSELLSGNFIQTCTLCVRTTLVRRYMAAGLPIEDYPVGDWPLCIYVSRFSEINYLGESLAVYRKVQGSAMNSGHASRLQMARGCLSMIESLCDYFAVDSSTRLAAIRMLQCSLLSFAALAGDKDAFGAAWAWLAANDPKSLAGRRRLLPLIVRSNLACRVLARLAGARQTLTLLRDYRRLE